MSDFDDTIKDLDRLQRAREALGAISLHGMGLTNVDLALLRKQQEKLTRRSMDLVVMLDEQGARAAEEELEDVREVPAESALGPAGRRSEQNQARWVEYYNDMVRAAETERPWLLEMADRLLWKVAYEYVRLGGRPGTERTLARAEGILMTIDWLKMARPATV